MLDESSVAARGDADTPRHPVHVSRPQGPPRIAAGGASFWVGVGLLAVAALYSSVPFPYTVLAFGIPLGLMK